MTIDAKNKTFTIPQSSDGKVYARYSSGRYVAPTLTVAGWGQTANGSIEPSGPITGPVPLAIFCHAIGTESSNVSLDTFRENGYRFDFGYGNVYSAGTWTHSGKPKGEQVGGPVAAHVYETPGTYILSLRVKDPTGNSYDLKTKIIAIDANSYWTSEGRTTTVLANASTSVWPTWANNTRYLLEAGKDYTRLGDINITNRQNVSISATGIDGKINSYSIASGGSGYTSGTYTYVPLWRGVGFGASANITVSSGVVTSVTIANTGSGYVVGDSLTVFDGTGGEIGSSGSGFSLNVDSIVNETDNKPIVHNIYADRNQISTPTTTARIIFNKLDANSNTNILEWPTNFDTGEMSCKVSAIDVLFHKCNAIFSLNGEFTLSSWAQDKTKTFNKVRRLFIHDCVIDGRRSGPSGRELRGNNPGGTAGGVFFNRGYEFVLLGSTVKRPPQQCVRVYVDRAFLAHNNIFDPLGDTPDGPIKTLGTITGGSGYTTGTYLNVPLTGGRGTGANGNVTISGGSVTAVVVANTGKDYFPNDSLSALNTNLGGTGSGFSVLVSTIKSVDNAKEAITIRAANASPIYANSQLVSYLDGSYPSIYSDETSIATTRNVVIADNILGSSTDSANVNWLGSTKPSNTEEIGAIERLIFERNTYPAITNKTVAYTATVDTRNVISRNETFLSSDTAKIGFRASNSSTSDTYTKAPGWARGPWYSDNWLGNDTNNTIDYQHKVTPGYISPPRPIANVEVYLTVRGWGQEVPAGGSIVGPAPLVVYFDAVDTRSANADCNTFREFGYHFDFGYDSANAAIVGNWQYSNKPKVSQIGGPIAAHMYEIPGTYTASVRAQNPQGEFQEKFVTIVVQDANVVYSGTKTVLVSNTGASDASYPSAATYNIAASGVVSFQSDRRYLFKAGENYSSYGVNGLTSNVFRFQIGTFGTGAKPVVNLGNNGIGENPTDKKLTAGIIQNANVRDMRITYGNDVHFNNCERYTGGFSGCADPNLISLNNSNSNNEWPINCGIWNSRYYANTTTPGGSGQCFYGGAKYVSFVGNDPYNGTHTVRTQPSHRGFIAHNKLNPPANDSLHQIKLYAGSHGNFQQSYPSKAYDRPIRGILPFSVNANTVADYPTYGFENRYIVVADNVIPPANNNWQIAIRPQNTAADERVRDVIVERVVFENNPGATNSNQLAVKMEGQNIVVRDCTIGTRLATTHYAALLPSDIGPYLPAPFRGPYYIPAPHPDIGAANNVFASVTGIIPERPGTYLSETITPSLISSGWGQNVAATGTITGPVPLAVFFDATGTTSSDSTIDPFNEIHYHFDFGYANTYTPGTWTHSGKPKGNQIGGPIAAHVYETPGTYKATVRAQDINGRYYDANVNIVAVDAHTYWTGSGKTNTTITVASGAWPTWANNTRYNLEAGGDYASFGTITINGRYNIAINGKKANVSTIIIEASGSKRAWSNSITISDITSTQSIDVNLPSEYVSFVRANARSISYGTSLKGSYDSTSGWYWPRYQTLYDCNFENSNTSVTGIWSTQSQQVAIMGCSSGNAKEHCVRTQNIYKLFFAHNFLYDPGTSAGPKHFLAIRAQGLSPWRTEYNGTDDMQSKYAVVADNKVGIGTETGHASNFKFSPNNDGVAHWVDMVRTERNTFNTSDAIRCIEGECTNLTSFETGMPDPFEGQITHGTLTSQYLGPYYSNQHRTGTDGTKRFSAPTQFYPLKAKS